MRRLNLGRRGVVAALAALLALASRGALAADFSADAYTAPVSPRDLLWTERAAPTPLRAKYISPFARLTLSFADDPLVLVNDQTGEELVLIDSELAAYLSGGFVLWHRLQAAVLLPAYFRSEGPGGSGFGADGVLAGDPGADLRLVLLDRSAPLELALAGTIRVPLGASKGFASNSAVSAWPRLIATLDLGSRTFASLAVGPSLRPKATVQSLNVDNALKFSCGVHLGLTNHWGLTGEVAGATPFSDPFARGRTPLELAGGVRFEDGPWVAALGGGPGLTNGFGSPDFRLLGTVGAQFGDEAAASTEPASAADEATDRDGDGLLPPNDRCPEQAEDQDGFEDQDGCPDIDNDADGLKDAIDQCPGQAEDKDGFEDKDGCPDTDNDADGVLDSNDKCPDQAEDKDGWQDEDGCPETDNDKDTVPDDRDRCPNEAETINGVDDGDGCPDLIRVEAGQIRTLEPIFFEYRSAKIQRRSEPVLVELATLLKSRGDLGKVSIEGHTDSQGADVYNLNLSAARASAVMKFLTDSGVDAGRLEAHGLGETKPIDDNRTEGGRAHNRRVEFHLVDLVGRSEEQPH